MLPRSGSAYSPGTSPGASRPTGGAALVVVANRLPVRPPLSVDSDEWQPSPGGLVTALTSVLKESEGVWIGWQGSTHHEELPDTFEGISLRAVEISPEEYEEYYLGFSNATLWPLYHDAIRAPTFHRHWWHTYVAVNQRYARAAAECVAPGGTVWVHDYQLQLVPQMLRRLRPDVRIGFFLHIPFPPAELLMQLPWRREILEGLLGADLVGFQVATAAANFSRVARRLTTADGTDTSLQFEGRVVRVGAFPISVAADEIAALAAEPRIRARAREIRQGLGNPELVLGGVDRLDYTKGIRQRVRAVCELFQDGWLKAGRDVMIQIAVPSRETDAHYDRTRRDLEQTVSSVNGDFGLLGSPVIHYIHQSLPFDELVALYLTIDIMVVTPFRDGMNLVAKEYVSCRGDLSGRLVLSEFAGAASELRGAFMVNPHDLDGIKEGIRAAMNAPPKEARARMARMRRRVFRQSVFVWADTFLERLAEAGSPLEDDTSAPDAS
jgi:alpha,alpha-trehalose-phosphate synthase [UDP-forming]